MPNLRSSQISPSTNPKPNSSTKPSKPNKIQRPNTVQNQSRAIQSQSKVKIATSTSQTDSLKSVSVNTVTPEHPTFNSIISILKSKIHALESQLEALQNHKCNCSTEILVRLEKIEHIIEKQVPQNQFAESIYKVMDREIDERLSTIDETFNSLAHLESTFESHIIQAKRLNDVESKICEIQRTADTCEALFDVNTSHITEIQQQIHDTVQRLNNAYTQPTNEQTCQQPNIAHNDTSHTHDCYTESPNKLGMNSFTSDKTADRGFVQNINTCIYSKHVKVILRDTSITDINVFIDQFGKRFESIMGRNIINKIAVIKYKSNYGTIHQIEVMIVFNIPLSYQYIDSFKFPLNWYFFESTTKIKNMQRNMNHIRRRRN